MMLNSLLGMLRAAASATCRGGATSPQSPSGTTSAAATELSPFNFISLSVLLMPPLGRTAAPGRQAATAEGGSESAVTENGVSGGVRESLYSHRSVVD